MSYFGGKLHKETKDHILSNFTESSVLSKVRAAKWEKVGD